MCARIQPLRMCCSFLLLALVSHTAAYAVTSISPPLPTHTRVQQHAQYEKSSVFSLLLLETGQSTPLHKGEGLKGTQSQVAAANTRLSQPQQGRGDVSPPAPLYLPAPCTHCTHQHIAPPNNIPSTINLCTLNDFVNGSTHILCFRPHHHLHCHIPLHVDPKRHPRQRRHPTNHLTRQ